MAQTVVVQTTASGAGAPVAVESIGTFGDVQLVKLLAGQSAATAPIEATTAAPDTSAVGMVVRPVGTVPVSGTVAVTGTVTVAPTTFTVNTAATVAGASVTAQVSGTVSVPTVGTLLGTVAVNVVAGGTNVSGTVSVSGPVQVSGTVTAGAGTTVVSGTVSVSGLSFTTAQPSTSAPGLVVWQANPAVSVSVDVSVTAISTVGTLLGTVNVAVVAGGAGGGSVTTTQASGVTGQIVWLAADQAVLTPTNVSGTVNVGTIATQLGTQVVTLATGGTLATVLGTLAVNVVAGGAGSVTTTQASGVTGQIVWLAASQTILAPTNVSGTVNVGTVATILGTQVVSVVPGVSVSAVVSGTVNVATVATLLGTLAVNVVAGGSQTTVVSGTLTVNTAPTVAGASVTIQQGASVSVSVVNTVVTVLGTQVVSVVPGVSVSAVVSGTVTPIGTLAVTGTIQNVATVATILGTQIVTLATGGTVAALDVGRTNVLITVVSSTVGISGTTMPFGLFVGLSVPVSGTTSWVVPAGKTFRILSLDIIAQNSVATSPALVRLHVLASTALPTWTSTVPVAAFVAVQPVSATVAYSACAVQVADIPAGATVGLAHSIGTSGASIVAAAVRGYLFP